MAATATVRVTPETRDRLNRISAQRGISAGELVDELARKAEDRALLEAMESHYRELHTDPEACRLHRAEIDAWDPTAGDSLTRPEMTLPEAGQGEVWFCDLDPIRGREQAGRRPAVVISVNQLGTGASDLAIVVPLTANNRPSPLYVPLEPPEGGLHDRSYAMPEMVRSISRQRLVERWGNISAANLSEIAHRVHLLTRAG